MSGKPEIIYWDACIFLAHLKNETRGDPLDMAGIQEQVMRIERSEIHLATSVITLIEVLESVVPVDARDKFKQIFQRRNCHLIDVSEDIANIARRNESNRRRGNHDYR